jgi:16S rRNA processing protein RimM
MSDAPVPKAADHSVGVNNSATRSATGEPSPRSASGWVLVARLIRPQGRRGELIAEILTDFPERFHQRSRLFLIPPERVGTRAREMQLDNFWFLRSRIVLKFQGIDSINDAETLRGFAVAIPAEERAPLDTGSVYMSDLIGCRVVDLNRGGVEVGEIADVDRESSSTELLVVRRSGAELLIPFVAEYLVRVDTANRRVEMRLPEGLLEINRPMTEEEKREAPGSRQGAGRPRMIRKGKA